MFQEKDILFCILKKANIAVFNFSAQTFEGFLKLIGSKLPNQSLSNVDISQFV
jgi:hypothetical protein